MGKQEILRRKGLEMELGLRVAFSGLRTLNFGLKLKGLNPLCFLVFKGLKRESGKESAKRG